MKVAARAKICTGPTAARYLTVRLGDLDLWHWKGFTPDQIEYEDESPAVYDRYAAECAKHDDDAPAAHAAYAACSGAISATVWGSLAWRIGA